MAAPLLAGHAACRARSSPTPRMKQVKDDFLATHPGDGAREARRRCPASTTASARRSCAAEILENSRRPDGRALRRDPRHHTARSASCRAPTAPRSSPAARRRPWSRSTLGTSEDTQIIDTVQEPDHKKRFMLHYNFPPFSVGEVKFLRGPGRREIGHGALAERVAARDAARRGRASPTPSASCPTSWSPTARPRWPRSAAAPSP